MAKQEAVRDRRRPRAGRRDADARAGAGARPRDGRRDPGERPQVLIIRDTRESGPHARVGARRRHGRRRRRRLPRRRPADARPPRSSSAATASTSARSSPPPTTPGGTTGSSSSTAAAASSTTTPSAGSRRASPPARRPAPPRGGSASSRGRSTTTCASSPPPSSSTSRAARSSSTAPTAPPTGPRPRPSSGSAPTSSRSPTEPDGRNINEGCGSTHLEQRRRRGRPSRRRDRLRLRRRRRPGARRRRARAASFDGDEIVALAALHLKEVGELPGGAAVTVMTNYGFHQAMEAAGIEVATTKVGDRYVIEELVERGWTIGGEQSGHIIWTDFAATGDGLAAALLVMRALGDRTLADVAADREASAAARERADPQPRRPLRRDRALGGGRARGRQARGPRPGARPPLGHRAARPA